jgi:adenylate kinase
MILLLLGPQGAGKGTQGALIQKRFHLSVIGTGDVLRAEVATGSDMGRRIAEQINQGRLAPLEIVTELMGQRLQAAKTGAHLIVDGYPRDHAQMEGMLSRAVPDAVLLLEIDDTTAVKRLGQRWTCAQHHIYNAESQPPRTEGVCDEDGLPLTRRVDETPEAIRERLGIYHKSTEPMIDELAAAGVRIERINARGTIDEVHAACVDALVRLGVVAA